MRRSTGILILVYLAFLGYLLVVVPPWVVARLRDLQQSGASPFWFYLYVSLVSLGGTILVGSALIVAWKLWSAQKRKQRHRQVAGKNPSQLAAHEKQDEIDRNLEQARELQGDQAVPPEMRQELQPLIREVLDKQEEQTLELVAFGTISSGKSALLNALAGRDVFRTDARGGTTVARNEIPWSGQDRVILVDTPGLGEIDGAAHQAIAAESARDADLVLLVVDGPLRDSEYQLLRLLSEMEKRIVVCLNKADWYEAPELESLAEQLRQQLKEFVQAEDFVVVQAQPVQRPRVRVAADRSEVRESVEEPACIEPLAVRMMAIVQQDGRDLLLANLLLQSRGMVDTARQRVKEALDRRAWEVVNKYMWGAASAAALSPLPVLDLAVGSGITVKMVVDLAKVYHQPIDMDAVVRLLGQLSKNLLSILGVSAATPLVVAAIASLIKVVPGVGTVTGGVLQGLVQALITRWIGAVFIEYYRNEMQASGGSLAEVARQQWDHLTTITELSRLVRGAREHLAGSVHDGTRREEAHE